MPSNWIYFIALLLLLAFVIVFAHTDYFALWLWSNGQEAAYYKFIEMQQSAQFKEFLGSYSLPVFLVTAFMYWLSDDDEKDIEKQFMLLPMAYIPFSLIGHVLVTGGEFNTSLLWTHPLVIIPAGYLYIFPWVIFVRVFCKLRLVIES
ncbi:MAG: hypothetical protein ACK502_04170 [Alphaproteobacteria bacterium]